jgi:hypothetical protein
MRKAVFRDDAPGLSITDAHVVNHSIKAPHLIQLLGHPVQILQARGIANNDVSSRRKGSHRIACSPLIAGMQNDLVPLFSEHASGHQSKTRG